MNSPKKSPSFFCCNDCDYYTRNKKDYHKHLLTSKHEIHAKLNTLEYQNPLSTDALFACTCGKTYTARNSLWYHKKKCSTSTSVPLEKDFHMPVDDHLQMNLIIELVKQNQEFKQLLVEQNNTILEVAKNNQINNNNTINNNNINNNNSNNKTFNLHFFLNETCKDAMNMKDFIKSLELTMPELEKMGELGFAEGMSRLFVNRLNSMDITKRPIHCSDVKREIIHIKDDNKWERDNANLDRLRKIIKQITHKNIVRVDDWKQANPGCTEYNSRKYDHYLKLTMETIGPIDEAGEKRDFGKIIRRVAENTTIDKKYLCM
jgi:hypothetical protein